MYIILIQSERKGHHILIQSGCSNGLCNNKKWCLLDQQVISTKEYHQQIPKICKATLYLYHISFHCNTFNITIACPLLKQQINDIVLEGLPGFIVIARFTCSANKLEVLHLSTTQTTHLIWPTNHAWNSSPRFGL